jgi:serine/threonine-protein kinase HipA
MNGELVGWWSLSNRGVHEFRYSGSWLEFPHSRPISLSMPLQAAPEVYRGELVEFFFENLLPDSIAIRRRLQYRFGTAGIQAYDLLEEIGRDCVGAVQLLPPDTEPPTVKRIEADAVSEAEIAEILRTTGSPGPYGRREDSFRISIAGAQEKTAFLLHRGRWHIPRGSTPTTHIFKLPLGLIGRGQIDLSTSVENEWLCSRLLDAYGLRCAETRIDQFEDQRVLIVQRFDRRMSGDSSWWMRLPQEDMCQATGTSPDMKYECDGGPGILRIMKLLLASRLSLADRKDFLRAQILFWMLAAIDGHAKNFSIFLEAAGRFSLTPLYDVLSAYPVMGHTAGKLAPEKVRMAMAVYGKNRHYRWKDISARHWIRTGEFAGLSGEVVREILADLVEKTPGVISAVSSQLPADFPEAVAELIFQGLERAARCLK